MLSKNIHAVAIQRREGARAHRRNVSDVPNPLSHKDKMLGIDITGFDESAGLLRAPARIRAVHEAALVVHEAVQITSSSCETLTKRVAADVQQLGADCVTDLEDRAKDVDQTLPAVETEQHAGRAGDPRFVDQQTGVARRGALIRKVDVGHGIEAVSVAAEGQYFWFTAAPLGVQNMVDDDTIKPRPNAAAPLERRQSIDGFDQDLLCRILGILGVIQHAEGDVVDPGLMALDQGLEGVALAGPCSGHERLVLQSTAGSAVSGPALAIRLLSSLWTHADGDCDRRR